MDMVFLSRIQFALTSAFHYIYPPLSIGLGVILVIMEGMYLATKKPLYEQMTKFWVKVFGLTFAIGVATGIVLEFEFGTNWATYSRYVGDVFGSALAAEGIFAFFLESGFLAILLFGWNRVSSKMHFFSTLMVAVGSTFSAVWIVVANSWMHTPAGFHIVGEGAKARAEITDFWAMVFNPSAMDRLSHVVMGCWQAGAWLVISVSAYYLLKKKHIEFAKASIKIALVIALIASIGQLLTGHSSAIGVSKNQPAKLAAFEGHYEENEPAPFHFFGWVNEKQEKVELGLGVPGFLSFLVHGNSAQPVQGLRAFPRENWPPVQPTFQAYHMMILIGLSLIALSVFGVFFWWRGWLFETKWLLRLFVVAVLGPQIANQVGWMAAEVGRQPWIVYGLLKTKDAVSKTVSGGEVLISLLLFTLIYILLFIVFIFLLDQKIKKGPVEETLTGQHRA
ncbi:MAG: cytochrome ubiquinol oxidase subunit I [Candidatus Omnitrophica bacterium]|nr:cytochrome ubiquinol oxidase subunit I [Candidatus Omnitrophota bacterium]